MNIELNKTYKTSDGRSATVILLNAPATKRMDFLFCILLSVVDASGNETFIRCDKKGGIYGRPEFLVENVPDWFFFQKDEPVMYQNARTFLWQRGHYAGFVTYSDGKIEPTVWNDCKTSWAGVLRVVVRTCRRPLASELRNV